MLHYIVINGARFENDKRVWRSTLSGDCFGGEREGTSYMVSLLNGG